MYALFLNEADLFAIELQIFLIRTLSAIYLCPCLFFVCARQNELLSLIRTHQILPRISFIIIIFFQGEADSVFPPQFCTSVRSVPAPYILPFALQRFTPHKRLQQSFSFIALHGSEFS